MCLIVLKGTKVQIAEEDIICYKRVAITSEEFLTVYSLYHSFVYEVGKLYTQPLKINEDVKDPMFADEGAQGFCAINLRINYEELLSIPIFTWFASYGLPYVDIYSVGFHSYERKNEKGRRTNVKCIIPKGSEYVKDGSGLIVSNQIIISKKL